MRHLALTVALVLAVFSVAFSYEVDRPAALRAANDALDRAISVGSDELVPKAALEGASLDEVFFIHHPETLVPSYGVVPIRSSHGDIIGMISVDARSGAPRWYSFSYTGDGFPLVSAADAGQRLRAERHAIGESGEFEEPILIGGSDKHVYWRYETGDDVWLIDASRSDAPLIRSRDESYRRLLTPAPSLIDPNRAQPDTPGNLSASGDDSPLVDDYPPAYCLPGVPYHFQITDWYCGPASNQMMMDFVGEEIGQHDIGDVTNEAPSYGTMDTDNRRAAHFSGMSTAIQNPSLQGYNERKLGLACVDVTFFTNQAVRLKKTVYAGYPVFTLTWYDEYQTGGHYRVVKGYDDSLNVFVIHDPWYAGYLCGPDLLIDQDFFVDTLWIYTYWGMVVSPWLLTPTVPSSVSQGDTFSVDLDVVYPGPTRFAGAFPCSMCTATINLSAGLALASGTPTVSLPVMLSGDTVTAAWDVVAAGPAGQWGMAFQAQGIVEGTSFSYASYSDSIGGHSYAAVDVGSPLLAGWDPEERLTNDDGSSVMCFPGGRAMIASDDGTLHLVWADTRDANSEIYYRRRSGGTWGTETRLTDDAGHSHSPCIAEDPGGGLHVAWIDDRDGDQEVFYKYFDPVGGWGSDEQVANLSEVDLSPAIAAGESEVYLAWQRRLGYGLRTQGVYFAVRTGLGWSAPVDVDASTQRDSYRPSVALGADGLVHLVYERQTSNVNDEMEKVVHQSWDGVTWSGRTEISNDSSYSRDPVIAAAPDSTLHVVWQDGENTGGDIFYVLYDGSAWQPVEQIVTGGTEACSPSVATSGADDVHVTWVDHRHGETEIYLVSNEGSGWLDQMRISNAPGASNLPAIGVDVTGGVYVAWTDMRHGNADLYFRATIGESGVRPEWMDLVSGKAVTLSAPYPVPAVSEIRFAVTLARASDAAVRVYDTRGRLVTILADESFGAGTHNMAWNGKDDSGRDVASGVYFLNCGSPLGSDTKRAVLIR
ncbi:MAG: C39 family peptidase [Candidatus Eisenbacteria bacterium]